MTENDRARCSSSSACPANFTCVIYASSNPLLRIQLGEGEALRIVLWSGPPLEVWEQGELFPLVLSYGHSRSTQLKSASFVLERSYTRCGCQSCSQAIYRASGPHFHPQKETPIVAHRYLKTIMLSLFVMNLLPLSFLDGGQVLQATIDLLLNDSEKTQDIEAGGRDFRGPDGNGRTRRSKTLIENSAGVGTLVLIGTSSTLGLAHWYRS